MRDDIATLHEKRLKIRANIAATGMVESQTPDGSDALDDGELDLQFDAMLEQIVSMRNTMEQLNVQKQLLERELLSASSDILGRFGPFSAPSRLVTLLLQRRRRRHGPKQGKCQRCTVVIPSCK